MATRKRLNFTLYVRCLSCLCMGHTNRVRSAASPFRGVILFVELLVILGEEIRSQWTVMIMVIRTTTTMTMMMMMMMCYSMCWRVISFFCGVVCTGVNGSCSTACTETAVAVSKWDRI
jgi:hypothetical protein